MSALMLETPRLHLTLESTDTILARIAAMPEEHRAQVSPAWIAQLESSAAGPWTHGFAVSARESGAAVGSCGFKGPPDEHGAVEVAYAINTEFRGFGFAKEAAAALVSFALAHADVRMVRAHTLPEEGPSPSVLRACGFTFMGEVMDPEDGLVWRWEIRALGQ